MRARNATFCLLLTVAYANLIASARGDPVRCPIDGHYYELIPAVEITWDDAYAASFAYSYMGVQGHLATITDRLEQEFVYNNVVWANCDAAWLGGYQSEGHFPAEPATGWNWVTGEPWEYTHWAEEQPNDAHGAYDEQFLVMYGPSRWSPSQWHDMASDDVWQIGGFIIEYPLTDEDGTHAVRWTANGNYYEYVYAYNLNWTQALVAASEQRLMGVQGHLATIADAQEQAFIRTTFSDWYDEAWLGGYQTPGNPVAQGWNWVTGEPWSYTNWASGAPNDSWGVDEDRLVIRGRLAPNSQNNGKWEDVPDIGADYHDGYYVEFEQPLRLRLTGIEWSQGCTLATARFETNMPVQRYYHRLFPTQSGYTRTAMPSATYAGLGEGYYLIVVTAKDTQGLLAPIPCRVWFYNKPLGQEYQVYLRSYSIHHNSITVELDANRTTNRYYARLYNLESTMAYCPGGVVTYSDLDHGMYYFLATGKELATGGFPPVPPGPARQFFYIDTWWFWPPT